MSISAKSCIPCQGGIPPLSEQEAKQFLREIPKWAFAEDSRAIHRKFSFGNFVQAQIFVNKVGDLAEEQGHHPDISFGWGYADIRIQTHKINGLHENDFILAAKIDELSS